MTYLSSYQSLDGVRLNMVVDSAGKFRDSTGSSRGISNDLDRALLVHLRKLSDVFVTGGSTARSENYRVPKTGKLAIVSRATVPDGAISLRPPETVSLPNWVIDELKSCGFRRILLEVGPSLARQFLAKNLVDEFCLTVVDADADLAKSVVEHLGSNLEPAWSEKIQDTLFTVWRRGNE